MKTAIWGTRGDTWESRLVLIEGKMLLINILQRKAHHTEGQKEKAASSPLSPGSPSAGYVAQGVAALPGLKNCVVKVKVGVNVLDHGLQLRFLLFPKS